VVLLAAIVERRRLLSVPTQRNAAAAFSAGAWSAVAFRGINREVFGLALGAAACAM
jgi:hypothetical protein